MALSSRSIGFGKSLLRLGHDGTPVTVPASWFNNNKTGTAVGLSSTSKGAGPPFTATWDLIEVTAA